MTTPTPSQEAKQEREEQKIWEYFYKGDGGYQPPYFPPASTPGTYTLTFRPMKETTPTPSQGETTNYTPMYRQGDVYIKPVTALPKGAKKVDHGILALGEVTGHKHQLVKTRPSQYQLYEDNSGFFLEVKDPTELVHEEHKTIVIQPGLYDVDIQQEYDYFQGAIRRVQD